MSVMNIFSPALISAIRAATTIYDPSVQGGFTQQAPSIAAHQPLDFDIVIAYLNVTVAPGVDTVLLKMQEQEPITGTWFDVPGAATLAQVATGLVRLCVAPGVAPVAASVSGVTFNGILPAVWRLVIVHSAGTNFTYSLSVTTQKNP